MKFLWYVFSYLSAEPWVQSLRDLPYDLHVERYDTYDSPDRRFLDAHDRIRPDIVIVTLTAGGRHIPSPGTLEKIKAKTPLCFLSGDLSDPPWWPYLEKYRPGISIAVNFDGNEEWPKQDKDFTCLCPISPTYYLNLAPLKDRPIHVGFMGTYASPSRQAILAQFSERYPLVLRPANNVSDPYQRYADFMKSCRIVPNIPISGSDAARQVKARVVEAGLAGCVLLDHVSSPAKRWFTPGVDYIEYDNPKNVITYDEEMFATNLRTRIYTKHSPTLMWERIIKALA